MGNKNDGYFIQNPSTTARQLRRLNRYYWIDPSVLSRKENGFYLKIFRENINILPCENLEQLRSGLEAPLGSVETAGVGVVCSSALGAEVYEYLQGNRAIEHLMVFCTNRVKGMSLKELYPKISEVHEQFFTLINKLRFIENERTQSIYYLSELSIKRLNRWTINWLTFSEIARQKGKTNFVELLKALYPGSPIAQKYESSFDLSKNECQRDSMVLAWMFQQNLFLQAINNILRKLKDTFSMSLIRQPLQDIYNAIRATSYSQKYPQTTAFVTLNLNSNEVAELQTNPPHYLYCSHFLICELDDSINKKYYNDQYKMILKLQSKPDDLYHDEGGFYISKEYNKVVVNLGNVFKITQINLYKREVYLQSAFIPKEIVNSKHELKPLQLHRQFTRYVLKHIPGQLLSSYFNDQLQIYNTHVKKEISILQSTNANLELYKINKALEKCKLKVYFHIDGEVELEKKILLVKKLINQLEDLQKGIFKVKVYFLLIEVNMRAGEITKFAKCLMRLKQFYEQKPQNFTQQQTLKLRIYRIYCFICTSKTQIQQNSQQLRQLQAVISQKIKQQKQVSDLYYLLLLTTSKCEQLKGNTVGARQILTNILGLIKQCQGQNSIYLYYYELRLQVRKREKTSIELRQKERKKSKVYSSIQPSQLDKSELYPIDLSQFNLSPYQISDLQSL